MSEIRMQPVLVTQYQSWCDCGWHVWTLDRNEVEVLAGEHQARHAKLVALGIA